MFTFIWRVGCLTVILAVGFFVFALIKGGEPLRDFAKKSGSFISESASKLAETADSIKQTKDNFVNGIKKWTDKSKQ